MSDSQVRLDFGFCTAQGSGANGLDARHLEALSKEMAKVHKAMEADRKKDILGFWNLPAMGEAGLKPIQAEAERLSRIADTLVVLGIGGSALGATAVDMALSGFYRHAFPRKKGMRLFVADNPDPRSFGQLLDGLDLATTAFNVVSKSGSTAETMAQFMIVLRALERALGHEEAVKRIVFTTDPEKGNLRLLAGRDPYACLEVPPNVGGRYSVMSAVGLLPLMCAGHDMKTLLAGAADMAGRCARAGLMDNPAYMFAALCLHYWRAGRNVLVMMPYATDLFGLAQWFAQLWAESLGKAKFRDGKAANVGQVPVAAVGATDQHSQLQLYMEGPQDKLVCFVTLEDMGREIFVPHLFEDIDALSYLGGQSLNKLIASEATATAAALAKEGRPSLALRLPALDEHALGQVMFLLEAATVAAGHMLNIDPLDQPGVELGKKLTYGLMGRKGFEEQAGEMAALDLTGRYIV
jgi:glucose-6-phosphate isomerase